MRSPWKTAALVICVAVSCAAVIAWQVHKRRENEQKLADAARACRIRAEHGDAEAQASLAYMFSHGQGVQRSYDEAARWYRKSADHGNPRGETGTGYMYYSGEGVLQDFAEAARWYSKAADQGYATGERDLGGMYYDGYGLPQDYATAAVWYRKAGDQGDAKAQYDLGSLYYYGKGVPLDRAEADRWFHKAAENGDESAQRFLGRKGRGLNVLGKVWFLSAFLAGLFFLTSYRKEQDGIRDQRALLAGILGLCYAGLILIGAYTSVWANSSHLAVLFLSVRGFVFGIFTTTFISVGWRHSARVMLIISGILFAGLPFALMVHLHGIAPAAVQRSIFTVPNFYILESYPVGFAIPAIVLLVRSEKNDGKSADDDNGLADAEHTTEHETEA